MQAKPASGKYYEMEETDDFKQGYLLVDDTMYNFDKDGYIQDEYDVSGKTIEEKVSDGRSQADIDGRTPVYVDVNGLYNTDIIEDNGKLITAEESFNELDEEEKEDLESFMENCRNK